jgi:hypothetical protein
MEGLSSSNTTAAAAADKGTSVPTALKRSNSNRSIASDDNDSEAPSDKRGEDGEDEPEYNWDDTDHMEQRYTVNIYTRYRNEKGLSFLL